MCDLLFVAPKPWFSVVDSQPPIQTNQEPKSKLTLIEEDISTWGISKRHGSQTGVSASVSGAGAWVRLQGEITARLLLLENSETYQEMVQTHGIEAGASAFWSWLGINANAERHRTEISSVLEQVSQSQEVEVTVDYDMYVTSPRVGHRVEATAFFTILQIEDSSGNTFNSISNSSPASDVGAIDTNGNLLPTAENHSVIEIR